MSTTPTLAKTINDRAVLNLMTGAVGDLGFNNAGHVCCRDENHQINSAILIRIDGGSMLLTGDGADFILENLYECLSKHDTAALLAFARAWRASIRADRDVIDTHLLAAKDVAYAVADAVVHHARDFDVQHEAYQSMHCTLAVAREALSDEGYRIVVRAYHKAREAIRDDMQARLDGTIAN